MTIIRKAVPKDWPDLWRVFLDVVSAGDAFVHESATEDEARSLWFSDVGSAYVAESDGDVVGAYFLKPNLVGRGNHVANAAYMVDVEKRGNGIGRRLGEHSIALATELGFQAILFNCVVETNTAAVNLWTQLGFKVIGKIPAAYRHRDHGLVAALIMHRSLSEPSTERHAVSSGLNGALIADSVHEIRRYKDLSDRAMSEVSDDIFFRSPGDSTNSIAVIVKHVAGNLISRWTRFFDEDGEKPNRDRENEFRLTDRDTRSSLMHGWDIGWTCFLDTVSSLTPDDLSRTVSIRGEAHTAQQALLRAMLHVSYHAGQILYLCRLFHPDGTWLTIAPGQSKHAKGEYRSGSGPD